jgi:hypothetical protein
MHLHLEAQMLCVERDGLLNIAHDVANIHAILAHKIALLLQTMRDLPR